MPLDPWKRRDRLSGSTCMTYYLAFPFLFLYSIPYLLPYPSEQRVIRSFYRNG